MVTTLFAILITESFDVPQQTVLVISISTPSIYLDALALGLCAFDSISDSLPHNTVSKSEVHKETWIQVLVTNSILGDIMEWSTFFL